jgi:signal transduction histidine kinase
MQARYHLAMGDADKVLLYTDSISMVTDEKDDHAAEVRAQALIMLGQDQEAALIYQRLFHEKDSVYGHEARQHLDELNTLFQLDELKIEQEHTKFLYINITVVSIALALLVLLLFGWRSAIKQKKVNEQLRIANERAKASAKMKSEFIRNISHEIRTPLNILSGFTQILTTPGMELPEDEKKNLEARVTENSYRITSLVDRMLEMSDASSEALIERKDQTDAQAIIADAISHSRIDLQTQGAAVTFNFPEEQMAASVSLLTNKLYAVRALAQLLENAVKFTHEGSVSLRLEYTDRKVLFTVEDTGIGIPQDQKEHIFGEFVQLDEFVDGTGIGLPLARSIARRMGGDLWLDTNYSKGARFVFELLR